MSAAMTGSSPGRPAPCAWRAIQAAISLGGSVVARVGVGRVRKRRGSLRRCGDRVVDVFLRGVRLVDGVQPHRAGRGRSCRSMLDRARNVLMILKMMWNCTKPRVREGTLDRPPGVSRERALLVQAVHRLDDVGAFSRRGQQRTGEARARLANLERLEGLAFLQQLAAQLREVVFRAHRGRIGAEPRPELAVGEETLEQLRGPLLAVRHRLFLERRAIRMRARGREGRRRARRRAGRARRG